MTNMMLEISNTMVHGESLLGSTAGVGSGGGGGIVRTEVTTAINISDGGGIGGRRNHHHHRVGEESTNTTMTTTTTDTSASIHPTPPSTPAWPRSRLQSSRFACLRCCGNLINSLIRLRNTPEELEQRYKSKEIDKFLDKEKQTFRRQVRNHNLPAVFSLVSVLDAHRCQAFLSLTFLLSDCVMCSRHIFLNLTFPPTSPFQLPAP